MHVCCNHGCGKKKTERLNSSRILIVISAHGIQQATRHFLMRLTQGLFGFSHRLPSLDVGKSKLAPLLYLCALTVSQAGDTHPKPGPKYQYGGCGKGVRNAHKAIRRENCCVCYHKECVGMLFTNYENM